MKRKIGIISFVFVFLLMTQVSAISASAGRLKGSSIVECNGYTYGQHGDGHWHYAVMSGGYWYPDGSPIGYDNPCQVIEDDYQEEAEPANYNTVSDPVEDNTDYEAQEKERAEQEAKEEAERVAQEKKDEEARVAQEAKEKKEAEEKAKKEEKEKALKASTKITDATHKGENIFESIGTNAFVLDTISNLSNENFTFKTEHIQTIVTTEYRNSLEPFTENVLDITIKSADGTQTNKVSINVIPMGTVNDIKPDTFNYTITDDIIIDNHEEPLQLNSTQIKNLKEEKEGNLSVNGITLGTIPYTFQDNTLKIDYKGLVLSIPVEKTSGSVLPAIGSITLLGVGGFFGFKAIKRKKSK